MSSFREFSDKMLRAVFEEGRHSSELIDLSLIPQKYGFAGNRDFVQDWAEAHAGFLKFEQGAIAPPPIPLMARISGAGRLHVEANFGDKDGVPPLFPDPPLKTAITPEAASSMTTSDEVTITANLPLAHSSEAWTGATLYLVDSKVISKLRSTSEELAALAGRLNYHSEEDERDLKGLAAALVNLSSMAEPDLPLILKLLAHPKFKIYAALFAAAATIRGALGV